MLIGHAPGNQLPALTQRLNFQGVWRASELAVSRTPVQATGFDALNAELPGGGWPRSALIEFLLPQFGIGEMQLLKPALVELSQSQKIVLIQPPYAPQIMACQNWGIQLSNLYWIKTHAEKSAGKSGAADSLWAAEQVLKRGGCGAIILWQNSVRNEALRRLHLAAQEANTWLWLMRPDASIAVRHETSPAPLRIALQAAAGGVSLQLIKRRGPHSEQTLFIALRDMPAGRVVTRESDQAAQRHNQSVPAAALPC